MFHQHINLPLITESVNLTKLDLQDVLSSHNLSFRKVFVFTGGPKSSLFADFILKNNSNNIAHVIRNTDNSLEFVAKNKPLVYEKKADLIIGIGGGAVLDTAKFLATKTKLPYIAVPTVVSSDALASPISILKNENSTKGYSVQIPSGILIDYDVITSSGEEHIHSGLGDIFSNISALNDWDLAVKAGKAKPNNFARFLSEVAVTNILNQAIDIHQSNFIKTYINSIIISGLAMNISGNSRPCSGSEHLIAHSLVHEELVNNISHGTLVGHFTPFCLHLQKRLRDKLAEKIKKLSMKCELISSLEPVRLKSVFKRSTEIRGKRYTVLNEYSADDLVNEYRNFVKYYYR